MREPSGCSKEVMRFLVEALAWEKLVEASPRVIQLLAHLNFHSVLLLCEAYAISTERTN
jgi:hypothetical protein